MRSQLKDGQNVISEKALELMMQVAVADPLDSVSRAEIVMRRFEAAISIGLISSGDHLPPEAILAEGLGVSPLTLRHGLYLLRDKGLVETRRGRGGGSLISGNVLLSDSEIDQRLRNIATDELRDLYDLATVMVRGAARLCAQRAEEKDLSRLRTRNEQFLAETTGSGLRRSAGRFYIALGVAAQSQQLTSLLVRIQTEIAPLTWPTSQINTRKEQAYVEHAAIIDAISSKDIAEAERLVTEHFEAEEIIAVGRHLQLISKEAVDDK